jgi:molybdopterin-guanine dinucleotide biosynthesis protein A
MITAGGIILAGGKGSRFHGNKALAELDSVRLVDRLLKQLKQLLAPIYLVSNAPADFTCTGARILKDLIPGKGPLSGIHAGLSASDCDLTLVVACDLPFVQAPLVEFLLGEARPGDDLVVPLVNGYSEPLLAVYRQSCLPLIDSYLRSGKYRVTGIYEALHVRFIPEGQLAPFGGARNFFNINTAADLGLAREMLSATEGVERRE